MKKNKILIIEYNSIFTWLNLKYKLIHIYKILLNKPMKVRINLNHKDILIFKGKIPKRKYG